MGSARIEIDDDLSVSVTNGPARLTPAHAFDLAEMLIRKGMRRIIDEEAHGSGLNSQEPSR